MKRLILVIALWTLLAGCATPPTSGYVYAKHMYEAYTQIQYEPYDVCTGGGTYTCTITERLTDTYHPAQWLLDINTCDEAPSNTMPVDCQINEVEVSEQTYNSTALWQYYNGE